MINTSENILKFKQLLYENKLKLIQTKESGTKFKYGIMRSDKTFVNLSYKEYMNISNGKFKDVILTKIVNKELSESLLNSFRIDKREYYIYKILNNYPFYTKNISNVMFGSNFDIKKLESKLKEQNLIPESANLFHSTNYQMFNMFAFERLYHFSIEKIWLLVNGFDYKEIKIGHKIYIVIN